MLGAMYPLGRRRGGSVFARDALSLASRDACTPDRILF